MTNIDKLYCETDAAWELYTRFPSDETWKLWCEAKAAEGTAERANSMTVTRTERGWAGHFIASARCQFRRNTLLERGERRIVVSTVGALVVDGKFEIIGLDRYYETMAFEAQLDGAYWDADVHREVQFNSPWKIQEIEFKSDMRANDMHEAVVDELILYLQGNGK